jgi:hypothetical protein
MCCKGAFTAVNGVKNIAKGYAYLVGGINEELGKKRMAICTNCPHLKGGLVCDFCGCAMDAKTRLPDMECASPNNKRWLAEKI